jgi:hypothetical protein
MSSVIPIESVEDELEYERQQKQVCADNFMQAMILYNKSEDERKQAEKTNEILRRTLNHKDEMLEFLR